ncbi:MAG: hypothetical protein IKA29_06735, partial [Clostridia bacterium]|nr:hypothetical protein [Clostridia bacterium]
DTYTGDTVAKLGHSLNAGVVTKQATCTEAGEKKFTCQRTGCGYTETQTIDPLGHTWTDATCTTAKTCSVCSATEGDPLGHTYTNVVYSWTKTGNDYTACKATGTCSVCGAQESVTVEDTIKDSAEDGFEVIQPVHSTCTTNGSTTYNVDFTTKATWAGTTSTTVVNPFDTEKHNPKAPVEENVIEVSCEVDGHKEIVVYCADCGHEITRTVETTPKLGHDIVEDPAVSATCTTTGLTAGSHCARCNEILVAQTVVPAKGHSESDVVVSNKVDPTCTATGSQVETVYCTVCNAKLSETTVVLDAKGHTPETLAAVSATCTVAGLSEGSYCTVCSQVLVVQTTIPALGHSWNEGVVTTDPTCTTAGVRTYTCTREGCGQTKTETIDAIGHNYVDIAEKPATCTEAGYTAYKQCENCNDIQGKTEIPAKGHSFVTYTSNGNATCTADGTKTATCENGCGTTHTIKDAGSATGHTVDTIDKTTAKWNASFSSCSVTATCKTCGESFTATTTNITVVTVESTCEGAGAMKYTATFAEDITVETTVAITAKGHTYKVNTAVGTGGVVAPTCTEQGYTAYICTECGAEMSDKYTAPTGHNFGAYTSNGDATCTTDG